MIDILYIAWERHEFTEASLKELIQNTNWKLVRSMYVYTDGDVAQNWTYTTLACPKPIWFCNTRLNGPVAIFNHYLDTKRGIPADFVAKVDNDFVVCPYWLDVCYDLMIQNPGLGLLGIEPTPFYGEQDLERRFAQIAETDIHGIDWKLEPCRYIGGIGLFRLKVFNGVDQPVPARDGRYGFTGWQIEHEEISKAWVSPPLPVFLLDHLPFEPWMSLCQRYEVSGFQRRQWGFYPEKCSRLWDWWVEPVTQARSLPVG